MNFCGRISLNHTIEALGEQMGTPVEDVIVDELAQLWKHRADARNMWMAPTTARLLGAEHDPEASTIELRKRIEELPNHDQRTVLLVMLGYRSSRSSVGARLKELEAKRAFGRPLKQGSLRKLGSEGSVELSKALVALDPEHAAEDGADRWFDEFYTPERISEMQQRWTAAIGGEDAVTERLVKMMESPAMNAASKRAYESFVAQQKPDEQSEKLIKLLMQMPSVVSEQTSIIREQMEFYSSLNDLMIRYAGQVDSLRDEVTELRQVNVQLTEALSGLKQDLTDVLSNVEVKLHVDDESRLAAEIRRELHEAAAARSKTEDVAPLNASKT